MFKGIKTHFRRAFISQIGFLFKDKKTAFITGFIISLLSIVAGWIPDGLNEFFFEKDAKGIILFGIAIFILTILILCAYKLSEELEYDIYEEEPEKRKVLILFLSDNKPNKDQIEEIIQSLKEISNLEEKIEKIQNSDIKNWRMPLEAIKFHLPKLEKIIVVTSPSSSKKFNLFRLLSETVFNKKLNFVEKKAADFESVKHIFNLIRKTFEELEKENYKDKDIIIDVTGGTKPVSIAGALTTSYYPSRKFQYISNVDYSVKSYDVRLISRD
ncbi:CRISPR-associated protein (Cas_Cas02710) [Balnearium lithotrophicum]|uniref:CRISPR-associated protein (Cas_Cas02710) n=1 Tax=Balnearium lithotrophicum TaxID=223788 RepID=A0A521DK41_9BACT|nr:hypothetical protein [Balnearium lithotrophicum]SMO71300.1 CRISPR-associated protein (Cas_Cas02710) [Balnearium lithotrophicum]